MAPATQAALIPSFEQMSEAKVKLLIAQFIQVYGLDPLKVIREMGNTSEEFIQPTQEINDSFAVSRSVAVFAEFKEYISEFRAISAQKPIRNDRTTNKRLKVYVKKIEEMKLMMKISPRSFLHKFNEMEGMRVIKDFADALVIKMRDRRLGRLTSFNYFGEKEMIACCDFVSSLVKNPTWCDQMTWVPIPLRGMPVIEAILAMGMLHHAWPTEAMLKNSIQNNPKKIAKAKWHGYLNRSRKVPSIEVRSKMMDVIIDLFENGKQNAGWATMFEVFKARVPCDWTNLAKSWFDIWFAELKCVTKDLWRIWKGIDKAADRLFDDMEHHYFRLTTTWRLKERYDRPTCEYEMYLAKHLKLVELFFCRAPSTMARNLIYEQYEKRGLGQIASQIKITRSSILLQQLGVIKTMLPYGRSNDMYSSFL